jgi:GNAT superfamily N-acetyltransferase
MASGARDGVVIRPITRERLRDFEALMKTNSITGSCWDIWPRRMNAVGAKRRAYWQSKGVALSEGNRRDAVAIVKTGAPFGLLAYVAGQPVGFISVGPRSGYPRVDTSKTSPPVDDLPVWAVPCFYVHRQHRGIGVTTELLRAAVEHAGQQGAPAVEGYPRADRAPRVSAESAFFGTEAQFRRAGYRKIRGVRPDLPRGWAPRVTMRATCAPVVKAKTSSRSRTRSRAAS